MTRDARYMRGMEKKSTPLKLDMRVTPDFLALIDDLRREEPDLPSRSELVRRAIEAYKRDKSRETLTESVAA